MEKYIGGKQAPFAQASCKRKSNKKISGEPKPLRKWTFDEGMEPHEDILIEEITEVDCPIEGLMTVYKKEFPVLLSLLMVIILALK